MSDALPPRPLTPQEVAERWGCSHHHVLALIRRRELRAIRISSRIWRIPLDALVEFEVGATTGLARDDQPRPAGASSAFLSTAISDLREKFRAPFDPEPTTIVLTHSRPRRRKRGVTSKPENKS